MTPPREAPSPALTREIEAFRALSATLAAERAALLSIDADALVTASTAKAQQVAALQAMGRERTGALSRAGLPVTREGIDAWLATDPDPDRARSAWHVLAQEALAVQQANVVNGRLIARCGRHYDAAFQTLAQAAGAAPVYGADGLAKAAPLSTRRIAV